MAAAIIHVKADISIVTISGFRAGCITITCQSGKQKFLIARWHFFCFVLFDRLGHFVTIS